jgi:hypothetical protein
MTTMTSFNVIGFDEAHAHIKEFQRVLQDSNAPFLDEIGQIVHQSIADRFNAQGPGWEPRKDPKGTWPILDKTGRMRDAAETTSTRWIMEGTERRIEITTPNYGVYHQHGTQKMVKRKFVEFARAELEAIKHVILNILTKVIHGGRN